MGSQSQDDFLKHLERTSVRFNNGGSGSIVSTHGLLLTNHHVGEDCIQKLSTAEHDYMANGFSSSAANEEKLSRSGSGRSAQHLRSDWESERWRSCGHAGSRSKPHA